MNNIMFMFSNDHLFRSLNWDISNDLLVCFPVYHEVYSEHFIILAFIYTVPLVGMLLVWFAFCLLP